MYNNLDAKWLFIPMIVSSHIVRLLLDMEINAILLGILLPVLEPQNMSSDLCLKKGRVKGKGKHLGLVDKKYQIDLI